jgi:hypothetical protein
MSTPDQFPIRHGGQKPDGQSGAYSVREFLDDVRRDIERRTMTKLMEGSPVPSRGLYPFIWTGASGRSWCEWIHVTFPVRSVANGPVLDLGGSKVGNDWVPLGPPQVRGHVALIVSEAWKRTFGDRTHVFSADLQKIPHLTGSHWVPLGPGPSAGNRNAGLLTGSRPIGRDPVGTRSPGVCGLTQEALKITDPVADTTGEPS